MISDLRFDIAFSYASEDAWIARDLYNLIAQSGLSVYCYDQHPDRAAGFLRARLLDIYRDSRMNVMLWSRAYASASSDSFPAMERRCTVNRHVEKGDAETLFVIRLDDEGLARDLDTVLVHDIRRHGLFGTARLLIARIGRLAGAESDSGVTQHPAGTEAERGQLHPCTFTIVPTYESDPRRRWHDLADVLVSFPNPLGTRHVYLIPSGSCAPLLRHSDILRTEPGLLERKRDATRKYAQSHMNLPIEGFWFSMRKGEVDIATVYAPSYDRALNASLAGETAGSQPVPGVGAARCC